MDPWVQEWANLAVRWAHVLAGILWIGDSFLFIWLDARLSEPRRPLEGDVVGEMRMAHGGGFYEVVKRRSLAEIPPDLAWFKWESYSTWITGFLLLIIVYWAGGRAMLLDAASPLSHGAAVGIGLGGLALGTAVYHALCRTPLIRDPRAFGAVGLALVLAVAWGSTQVFTPRAAFIQVGALLGTVMASNVFFVIIPAQAHMLASTAAGTPVDTSYGARAKQRSVHNHYLTLPVLFTMVSNHFPSLYGNAMPWLVLALVVVVGVGVKYAMNFRGRSHPLALGGTAAALVAVMAMTRPAVPASPGVDAALAASPPVSFATADAILRARCVSCHAAAPTDPAFAAPPLGVVLDSPEQVRAHADRIAVRAVQTRTMPLGNLTGMTDAERALLGAWIAQGADTSAPGPARLPPAAAPMASPEAASP